MMGFACKAFLVLLIGCGSSLFASGSTSVLRIILCGQFAKIYVVRLATFDDAVRATEESEMLTLTIHSKKLELYPQSVHDTGARKFVRATPSATGRRIFIMPQEAMTAIQACTSVCLESSLDENNCRAQSPSAIYPQRDHWYADGPE